MTLVWPDAASISLCVALQGRATMDLFTPTPPLNLAQDLEEANYFMFAYKVSQ